MLFKVLITSFIWLTFLQCNFKNVENVSSQKNTETLPSEQIDSVIYEATTRGFFEKIVITENNASYTNDRNSTQSHFKSYEKEKWNDLIEDINKVGPANIEKFEAPTKMHEYDGAALATIEIHIENKVYRTQTFDNGYPPKDLSGIYKAIQTIKESIVKQ